MKDETTKQLTAWLGVAAAVVSLLAFFGITSWNELTKTVFPKRAAKDACRQAWDATRTFNAYMKKRDSISARDSAVIQIYAKRLGEAKAKTNNDNLKAAFDANIYSLTKLAEALEEKTGGANGFGDQSEEDGRTWSSLCRGIWRD
ncbi:hypothetical protein ACIRQP_29510 [Streptomyces sp. NPDC102274]|uniref:hypothetical protein n=1 Tax=Streptomyces sp. NPDC102274 TaxID=3366151 RepID=UPI0038226526